MKKTRVLSTSIAEFLKVWGLLGLVVVAGFLFTYQFVTAPPPRSLRIATGMKGGAYFAFAQEYARLLADDGITLEVVPTAGSVENLDLLKRGAVSLALVQGGSASPEDRNELQSLGSLFLEPVWVFARAEANVHRFADLEGKRVSIGATGSGTRLLALQLLTANDITESNTRLISAGTSETVRALSQGEIDAAILVSSVTAPVIHDLLMTPGLAPVDWERAAAYERLFPFLTPVVLSEGVLDLARNVPPRDTSLVATSASLAARRDLHAGLIPALLNVVTRVHQGGGILEHRRQFPSVDLVDLPLNQDASRYIRNGPSFLYRWLPYGTAVVLDRLKILVLPFIALLIPLFRIAPPLYQWRIRSRIYRWYAEVREIDTALLSESKPDLESLRTRLRILERDVASISVPLAYTGEQYHLRLHIRLLQERLERFAEPR